MNITAVIKRMARLGYDMQLTVQHNGWVHLAATRSDSGDVVRDSWGELVVASAALFGDTEYNVLATFDVVAMKFWKRWGKHLDPLEK